MGDGAKWFGFKPDGTPNGGHSGIWTTFYNAKKLTDMHYPGPSDCFVMFDENPQSDDDATFYHRPRRMRMALEPLGRSFQELCMATPPG